jgi:hypothetical protein
LLPDGRVLLVGGLSADEGFRAALSSVEIFDPSDHSYTPAASLPEARFLHRATTLADGRILVTGGTDDQNTKHYDGLIFDPSDGTWSAKYEMAGQRQDYTQTLMGDGTVWITAGYQRTTPFTLMDVERFDPATNTFTRLMGVTLVRRRAQHLGFLLDDGRLLVLGGTGGDGQPAAWRDGEIYDPGPTGTGTFETVASTMSIARSQPFATKLPDCRVLVTGQRAMDVADADVFDPSTDTFVEAGRMNRRRRLHAMTAIHAGPVAGRALVSGGSEDGRALRDCDLFDPTTNTFDTTASMVTGRSLHTATALPDGRVFVFGGRNDQGPVPSGEILEPVE